MAFDANGAHNRVHNWGDDAAGGVNITASRFDAENDDFSAALTALAAQIQDGSAVYILATGTADVITLTLSPAVTAYAAGQAFVFKSSGANTGAVTVNVNGLGAKGVKKAVSTDLAANDIASGALILIVYDGTNFQAIAGLAASSGSGDVSKVGTPVDNQVGIWTGDGTIEGDTDFTWDGDNMAIVGDIDVTFDAAENLYLDGTTTPRTGDLGILRIESTSGIDSTRAINLVVDAAGFGAVQGQLTRFTMTGFDSQTIGSGHVVQGDSADSTGGRLTAYRASLTGSGTGAMAGLFASSGVDPVMQSSGAEVDAESVQKYDDSGASFTDITTNAGTTATDSSMFDEDDDFVYIGHATQFNEIMFQLATVASGAGIKPTFEFSAGSSTWTTFSPIDGTNGMRFNGSITWALDIIPTWATDTVNGVASKYWIRIKRTQNSLSTVPIEDLIQIVVGTEYIWDKDGNVYINSVELGNETDTTLTRVSAGVVAIEGVNIVTTSSTDTLTNKTFDANGTGNSLSNVDVADLSTGTDGELITWDSSGNPTTVAVGTSGHVLTSNGTGAAPTFQAASGGGGYSSMQVFTASGTWNRPTGVILIKVYSTGGGGGGSENTTAANVAAGGAGGTCIETIDVSAISSETVTIGAGGAGGTSNDSGSDGGDTTFGTHHTATGGTGGTNGGVAGPGGVPTGGDVNITGGEGGSDSNGSGGGGSYYGSGGEDNGGDADAYGAGGAGGKSTDGGDGAAGIIIVEEYK